MRCLNYWGKGKKPPPHHLSPCSYLKVKVKVAQWCPTLCDPMAYTSPWNSPGQNTGAGSLSLPQGIFPTQGLNPVIYLSWIKKKTTKLFSTQRLFTKTWSPTHSLRPMTVHVSFPSNSRHFQNKRGLLKGNRPFRDHPSTLLSSAKVQFLAGYDLPQLSLRMFQKDQKCEGIQ